jgi:hypothetical protein
MARDLKNPLSESSFDKSKGGPKLKSYKTSTGRKICYVESKRGSMRKAPCDKVKKPKGTLAKRTLKRAPKAPLMEGMPK